MNETVVDPRVSVAKFNREISQYRQFQDDYIQRGWWLVKADFPTVFVIFAAKTPIKAAIFGALIDFTNYDLWPPSVRLVDPFTMVPYKAKELPTRLFRRGAAGNEGTPIKLPGATAGSPSPTSPTEPTQVPPVPPLGVAAQIAVQSLAQSWSPEDVPFICLPGIREYHDNPAHTGDSWLLHRGGGAGTLHFILEQLYKYGVQHLRLTFQVQASFQPEEIPL